MQSSLENCNANLETIEVNDYVGYFHLVFFLSIDE